MDRLDFTSHINYNVPVKEKAICNHFDEIMSLYDIIGVLEASSIDATVDKEVITFNIRAKTSQERSIMLQRLSTFTVNKFGHNYYAEPVINNDCLTVTLKEKVVG